MTVHCLSVGWLRWACVLALPVFATSHSSASSEPLSSDEYLIDVWRSDEGLPRDGIISVAQGADGYLWICSMYELARFDGVRFVNVDQENVFGGVVLDLKADQFGNVWMGTWLGGLLQWRDQRLSRWLPEGASSDRVLAILPQDDGGVFVVTSHGRLVRASHGRAELIADASHCGRPVASSICQDRAGQVWFVTEGGKLVRINSDNAQEPRVSTSVPAAGQARNWTAVQVDAAGQIWAGTDNGLYRWQDKRFDPVETPQRPFVVSEIVASCESRTLRRNRVLSTPDHAKASQDSAGPWIVANDTLWQRQAGGWTSVRLSAGPPLSARMTDSKGNLWFSTAAGAGLMRAETSGRLLVLRESEGLPEGRITSLCEDREGNIWVGIKRIGLARLRERRFRVMGTREGLSAPVVWAVLEDAAGRMWFGTEGGGADCWQDGKFTQFKLGKGGCAGDVRSLFLDSRGTVWAGTSDNGIFRFEDGTFAPALHRPHQRDTDKTFAIYEDRRGQIWLGSDYGLFSWAQGRLQWHGDGSRIVTVRAITEDTAGRLWVGMWTGGVASFDGKQFTCYGLAEGLPHRMVLGLHGDTDGSVWIATMGGGLCRWRDGRFTRYSTAEGLPDNRICSVAKDRRGDLWLGSPAGIFRVSKRSLAALDTGQTDRLDCLAFEQADGLPTRECTGGSQPSIWPTRDGRLWFAMYEGAVGLLPEEIRVNQLPPPVLIEELLVDGVSALKDSEASLPSSPASTLRARRGTGAGKVLTIGPGRHLLDFRYTATSLTAPSKVRFKYRLAGLDTVWREAGTSRTAIYNVTAPGNYHFEVTACNNDGVWNETAATLGVTVLPYFWQTIWFRIGAFLMGVAVFGGTMRSFERRKLQRKLKELQVQQALEGERTRIARDIHDDVGASLTEIAMLSEFAQSDSVSAQQIKADAQNIAAKARESTQALDEIVWAINPRNDTLDGFATYACAYAQQRMRDAAIRCRLDVPSALPSWPLAAPVRHNLFLAFKEALNNVVKHARASELRIEMRVDARYLTVLIADSGQGFATESEKRGPSQRQNLLSGNGLANMRERLKAIGGAFECESRPGQGTRVKLRVKLPKLVAIPQARDTEHEEWR